MAKDPAIVESVTKQMVEYQEKGYIHRATEAELKEVDTRRNWYLPLGVALNPKKPEKIRIFQKWFLMRCDSDSKFPNVLAIVIALNNAPIICFNLSFIPQFMSLACNCFPENKHQHSSIARVLLSYFTNAHRATRK